MNINPQIRVIVIEIICLLYVLLFVYAATSKLLDFEHFRIELGQSPLLSAFADWISVLVPVAEYLTCLLIIITRLRVAGLFFAYGLMVMFTAYIFIILNYTSFVPCSCGGVLEKLDWKSHMIFNSLFVCLAITGILLYNKNKKNTSQYMLNGKLLGLFSLVTLIGISIVALLFILSENIMHYHNKLTRRFPHSPVEQEAILDLKLNSYYIAGVDSAHIYLGNVTAPLTVTTLDKALMPIHKNMIELNNNKLPFRGIKVCVISPYFFAADGTIPCIFRGKTSNWKAELMNQKGEYFTTVIPIDSVNVVVSTNSKKNGDNILGVIQIGNKTQTILNPQVLQKQSDGVFDTDGHLSYSKDMHSIIYLYAYRNQFTITDKMLEIKGRGTTIDTISQAKLSIITDQKYNQRKFSKPPLFVNKDMTVYKNLLFVNSAIPGRYETDRMWRRTSVIDVYDLMNKTYVLSFTINDLYNRKVKKIIVQNDQLYALIGSHILRFKMDSQITSKYRKTNSENLLAK
jgi:uncharacterized membrane protein YphA (DoxX/SURF4 family)